MRVVKASLGACLLIALMAMWSERDQVIEPYQNDGRSNADVQLGGVDLAVTLAPVEESPYRVALAPDTRNVPVVLAYAEPVTTTTTAADSDPAGGSDSDTEEQSTTTVRPATTTTTSPPPIHGGTAQLRGVVTGPDGPIPYATVRLERHTNDGFVAKDITTDAQGRWNVQRLLGGRYRVRSWGHESFTMDGSQVFFLAEAESRPVDMTLFEVEIEPNLRLIDAGNIYVGLTGSIAVTATVQSVDEDGLLVVSGLPGAIVTMHLPSGVTAWPTIAVADTDGVARFVLRCDDIGRKSAILQHREDLVSVELPTCIPEPAPPPPPPPTTTMPGPGLSPSGDQGTGLANG